MSAPDDWLLDTQRHINPSLGHHMLTHYKTSYWDRLTAPSIVVPFLVLAASVLFSSNILDLLVLSTTALTPSALRQKIWDAVVLVIPPSPLFALDDWLAPFPVPRQPFDRLPLTAAHEAKSSALARILGLELGGRRSTIGSTYGNSIVSLSQAGLSKISRIMPRSDPDRPPGLHNPANFCYQNSTLQALASLKPMRELLAKVQSEIDRSTAGGLPPMQTALTLSKLVDDLYGPTENGRNLFTPPMLKQIRNFDQQDAQEYFVKLLDKVEGEIGRAIPVLEKSPGLETLRAQLQVELPSNAAQLTTEEQETSTDLSRSLSSKSVDSNASSNSSASSNSDDTDTSGRGNAKGGSEDDATTSLSSSMTSLAPSLDPTFRLPLEGLVAQRVVCTSCNYSEGLKLDPFYCVTLPMPNLNRRSYDLGEMLDSFCAVDEISDVYCANCTLLKSLSIASNAIKLLETRYGGPEAARLQQPMIYTRLDAIKDALENEDFGEKTLLEKCNIKEEKLLKAAKAKQVGIARAPPSIAFHFQRSRYVHYSDYPIKDRTPIHYPLHLDLGPWYLGSAAPQASHSITKSDLSGKDKELVKDLELDLKKNLEKGLAECTPASLVPGQLNDEGGDDSQKEQWQASAQVPLVAGTNSDARLAGPIYELRAVVVHYGSHENGHYVCYRKHPAVKHSNPMPASLPATSPIIPPTSPTSPTSLPTSPPTEPQIDTLDSPLSPAAVADPSTSESDSVRAKSETPFSDDDTSTAVGSDDGSDAETAILNSAENGADSGEETEKEDEDNKDNKKEETQESEEKEEKEETEETEEREEEAEEKQKAIAEEEEEDQWWRLSDQNVYLSSEEAVLSEGEVFMLFYDRVDAKSVLRSTRKKASRAPPKVNDFSGMMAAAKEATTAMEVRGMDEPDDDNETAELMNLGGLGELAESDSDTLAGDHSPADYGSPAKFSTASIAASPSPFAIADVDETVQDDISSLDEATDVDDNGEDKEADNTADKEADNDNDGSCDNEIGDQGIDLTDAVGDIAEEKDQLANRGQKRNFEQSFTGVPSAAA